MWFTQLAMCQFSYRLATIVLSKGTFVSVARNVHSYYMNYQAKGPSYSMFVHTND